MDPAAVREFSPLVVAAYWKHFDRTGAKLSTKYNREGNLEDLADAIVNHHSALDLYPTDHPFYVISLKNMADAIWTRYKGEGSMDDLILAILHYEEALDLCPPGHLDRSSSLNKLAEAIQTRYERDGDLGDLAQLVQYYEEALDLRPLGNPELSLNDLTQAIQIQEGKGCSNGLDQALQHLQDGLALPLSEGLNPTTSLNNLAYAIWSRFDRSSSLKRLAGALLTRFSRQENLEDLTLGIQHLQELLDIGVLGSPDRAGLLNNLASLMQARYSVGGDLDDLTLAIRYLQEELDFRPSEHPDRFSTLHLLAGAFWTRYERERGLGDLALAVQRYQEALDVCPPVHSDRLNSLSKLATANWTRYEREGRLDDLTLAIQHYQQALDLCPPGHPDRSASLNNLANAMQARYERQGDLDELALAIRHSQESLDLRPAGDPYRLNSLINLASAIRARYEREGRLDDLTLAIRHYQEALDLCPQGHPSRSASLNNLANVMRARFEREGNMDELTLTIQYNQEALDLLPPEHHDRPTTLGNLANAIQIRYDREGNMDDLTLAIQHHEEVLRLLPPGHTARSSSLINLANAMQTRYDREGNLDDITLALQYHYEMLDLLPSGHQLRPISLNNLANTMWTRYKREGNLDDIILAIQYHRETLDILPPDHHFRPISLNNLANAIQTRYKHEGNLDELGLAIGCHQEALRLLPLGHPGRSSLLMSLATTLQTRYDREPKHADITLAIQYHQEALDLHPPGHPTRSLSLNNLANAIWSRSQQEGNFEDLTRAIQYHEEALELRPPGHPDRSTSLHTLAKVLDDQYSRAEYAGLSIEAVAQHPETAELPNLKHAGYPSTFEHDSQEGSRTRIISLLREASQSDSCSPRECLEAALTWVRISKHLAQDSALEAYTSALHRLDVVLALGETLNQRHDRLRSDTIFARTKDLGVQAATWALQHGGLSRAVELLEQGRSLLLAQVGRYRVELDDLRVVDSGLADRFARLSRLLDASIVSNQKLEESSSVIRDPYERYRKESTEWTQTVKEIRNLKGFETFLKPTPYERLQEAAAEGPIIMLIPNNEGCAALIVRNDAPIHHVDLPHATSQRLAELSNNFNHALNYGEDYDDVERECVDNLASLWNEVVGPIARALQNDLEIPLHSRVWWCPTSVACFVPLHAAGLYAKGRSGENFPHRYISSYTPTIRALLRARRIRSSAPKKLLVVSQPNTPGEPPLPCARMEANKIAEIVLAIDQGPPLTMTTLSSEAGTREAVQHEMESHDWIHFICHGVQVANQPLDSFLSLHDGHLRIRKIIEQNLPNADFAFLAACHSAAGDTVLTNEALHLAAAMQFAGFRGVVGTLWTMCDDDGPPLAEAFYSDMVKHGDHRRAAIALSKAIEHLRRNEVPIHRWIRFVHIGA